jgi:hypothetical protein
VIELLLGKPLLEEEFKLSLPRHVEGEEGSNFYYSDYSTNKLDKFQFIFSFVKFSEKLITFSKK